MTFVDHLGDLRRRLIYTIIVFLASIITAFFFVHPIYLFLIHPLSGQTLAVLGPTEVIRIYLMIAFIGSLVVTLPFALLQLWMFVSPGLTEREKKITLRFIPITVFMFLAGICFGYFLIFPMLFRFLKHLAAGQFTLFFTAANYFGFMTDLVLPFGFLFEMPIVVMFLTRLGILNPVRLAKMRRYAYLVLVILGSMLSPPEIVSHLSVTLPMILLYEISVVISRVVYGRKIREREEAEAAAASRDEELLARQSDRQESERRAFIAEESRHEFSGPAETHVPASDVHSAVDTGEEAGPVNDADLSDEPERPGTAGDITQGPDPDGGKRSAPGQRPEDGQASSAPAGFVISEAESEGALVHEGHNPGATGEGIHTPTAHPGTMGEELNEWGREDVEKASAANDSDAPSIEVTADKGHEPRETNRRTIQYDIVLDPGDKLF